MMYTDSENAAVCMDVLVKAVGIVDAERFIAYMNRESGDYTIARRAMFGDMSVEQLEKTIDEYKGNNPQIMKAFENKTIYCFSSLGIVCRYPRVGDGVQTISTGCVPRYDTLKVSAQNPFRATRWIVNGDEIIRRVNPAGPNPPECV